MVFNVNVINDLTFVAKSVMYVREGSRSDRV